MEQETKNVKNYDVGSIRVHLPLRNFIHELPLFHFSDLYGTIGISLIYNSLLHDGTNPFNINTGYKINLQKRIFLMIINYMFKIHMAILNKLMEQIIFIL